MVHEMTYVWLFVTNQDTDHKSESWYAAVRRLSPAVLGHELEARRGEQRKSVRVKLDDGRSVVCKIVTDTVPHAAVAGCRARPAGYDFGSARRRRSIGVTNCRNRS